MQSFQLYGDEGNDLQLERLADRADLKELILHESEVTDVGLAYLCGLHALEHLDLSDTCIGDTGLACLAGLVNMRSLSLASTKLTNEGLVAVRDMKRLQSLDLSGTEVDDRGLTHLAGLRQLDSLSLADTRITDAGLKVLTSLPRLEKLWLSGTAITDAGVEHLGNLTGLVWLYLNRTTVGDAGLPALRGLVRLEELGLDKTGVTDEGLSHVAVLKTLEGLFLPDEHITDAGLAHLDGLPKDPWVFTGPVRAIDGRRVGTIRVVKLDQVGWGCPTQWEGEDADGNDIYIRYRFGVLSVNWGLFQRQHGGRYSGDLSFDELAKLTHGFLEFDLERSCPHCDWTGEHEQWIDDEFCGCCGLSRDRLYGEEGLATSVREFEDPQGGRWRVEDKAGATYEVRVLGEQVEVRLLDGKTEEVLLRKRTFPQDTSNDPPPLSFASDLIAVLNLYWIAACNVCGGFVQVDDECRCIGCGRALGPGASAKNDPEA